MVSIRDTGAESAVEDDREYVPRRIARIGTRDVEGNVLDFEHEVTRVISNALRERAPRRFQAVVVGGEAGDGLSTLSGVAASAIASSNIRTTVIETSGTRRDVQLILEAIDLRTVMRRARELDIVPRTRLADARRAALAFSGVAVVAVLIAIVGALVGNGATALYVGVGAAVAAIGSLATEMLRRAGESSFTTLPTLVTLITDDETHVAARDLMQQLALDYGLMMKSRCLILDDYSRAHALLRCFVDSYFRDEVPKTDGVVDLWFVFDRDGGGQHGNFWQDARTAAQRPGVPTRLRIAEKYSLLKLDAAERRRLAEASGHPERAGYVTVKGICESVDPASLEPLRTELDRLHEQGRVDAIQVMHLLAVTALTGANLRWEQDLLAHTLIKGTKTVRATVLALLIPGLTPRERDGGLALLRERLDPSPVLSPVTAWC